MFRVAYLQCFTHRDTYLHGTSSTWKILWLHHLKVNVQLSHVQLFRDCMDYTVHGILQARKADWVAILFSRGVFPTQESNRGLPRCRRILYQLGHQGSPRHLKPFQVKETISISLLSTHILDVSCFWLCKWVSVCVKLIANRWPVVHISFQMWFYCPSQQQ